MKRLRKLLCAALAARLAGRKARIPEAGAPLMDAFSALSRARSVGPNGPNPISWADMAAWSALMQVPIGPTTAEIIMALDEVWLEHAYRRARGAPEGVKTLPHVSQHPINAGLLDAIMG